MDKTDHDHVHQVLSDADRMTRNQLFSDTPRLLDSETEYGWWNEIYHDVSNKLIPVQHGIDSVKHAWRTGYISRSSYEEYNHILYNFVDSETPIIHRGFILLQAGLSNFESVKAMIAFLKVIHYEEDRLKFQNLLDDPPDSITLPLLSWQIQCCIDGYANSKGYELGWKNGKLIFGYGGDDFD